MLSKYSPAQKAKSTAALLSALVLFLGVLAGYVTDILPTGNGTAAAIAGVITLVCGYLVRTATFLTNAAPTIEQVAKYTDETIALVHHVEPQAIADAYVPAGRHERPDPPAVPPAK
jgi:hypothetical protein